MKDNTTIQNYRYAGDVDFEMEMLKNEVAEPGISVTTPLFTIFCC